MNRKIIILLLVCMGTLGILIALSQVDMVRYRYIPVQVQGYQFLYKIDRITGQRELLQPLNDLLMVSETDKADSLGPQVDTSTVGTPPAPGSSGKQKAILEPIEDENYELVPLEEDPE